MKGEAGGDAHGLGYERVDDDPNRSFLIATMDATSQWGATRALRAWERRQLRLGEGQRLLDVGCGPGDAALALVADLGPDGEVVGIDVSEAMLAVARMRAVGAPGRLRFTTGDAAAIDEPDRSFDAVRSERTLQWLADPAAAVAEMSRVLRRDGRIALIDADWSTLRLDVGDDRVAAAVREALRIERGRPSNVGRRLGELVRSAGFGDVVETSATHRWTHWDPDESPVPAGCFSMLSLADDLVATGQLDLPDADRFVDAVHDAARAGRFSMALTMFAVAATKRPPGGSGT